MDTLLLARHALAGSNRDGLASAAVPGEGLTDEGAEQARSLAAVLEDEEISLGVSSELARTQETLRLALGGLKVPTVVVPELNEIDFGCFGGGPLAAYRAWAGAHSPVEKAPGGGESRADAAARYARGLRAVLARDEQTILVVGHALGLRYILDAAQGLAPAPLITPVEHAFPYRLGRAEVECAATLLEVWSLMPSFRDPPNEG